MNIKAKIAKRSIVAFPDAPKIAISTPKYVPTVKSINMDFKKLFNRLIKKSKK
jgi:hypothetical protein